MLMTRKGHSICPSGPDDTHTTRGTPGASTRKERGQTELTALRFPNEPPSSEGATAALAGSAAATHWLHLGLRAKGTALRGELPILARAGATRVQMQTLPTPQNAALETTSARPVCLCPVLPAPVWTPPASHRGSFSQQNDVESHVWCCRHQQQVLHTAGGFQITNEDPLQMCFHFSWTNAPSTAELGRRVCRCLNLYEMPEAFLDRLHPFPDTPAAPPSRFRLLPLPISADLSADLVGVQWRLCGFNSPLNYEFSDAKCLFMC